MHTCTLSTENLIEIGSVVSEMWPGKIKSRGCIYSGSRVYWAKYGIAIGQFIGLID